MPIICSQVFNEVCILGNGDAVCSCVDAQGIHVLGNINQKSIYEIFNGTQYEKLRQSIKDSSSDSYCPILKFNCIYKNINKTFDRPFKIEVVRLETTSYCNLRCPGCPTHCWMDDKQSTKRHPRLGYIPIDKIEEIFTDTKDTLKTILLYNFGEPFLDKRLLEILRLARRIVPNAFILISTNGTVVPDGWPEAIVKEGLIDRIIFSIDGASQETYGRYRVGGDFNKAFKNMIKFSKYKNVYKKSIPEVDWQYILFKWNDSDAEIKYARQLASEHGLTLHWLYTYTPGNSQKWFQTSEEFNGLKEIYELSCGVVEPGHGDRYIKPVKRDIINIISRLKFYPFPLLCTILDNNTNTLAHAAKIEIKNLQKSLIHDQPICGKIKLRNMGKYTWRTSGRDFTRLGVQLLDKQCNLIARDFRRIDLPKSMSPGDSVEIDFSLIGIHDPGEYLLRFDMVRERICWFSDKVNYYVDMSLKIK